MLVLSRKENEEIQLPELGVKIRVLKTGKSSVKIGIEAPSEVRVMRGELIPFGDELFPYESEPLDSEIQILQPH